MTRLGLYRAATPGVYGALLPLVFLEAQMQGDPGFYRRFFAQVFLYLEQYEVTRPWRGLLLFPRRSLNFGEEDPYQGVLATQVERFYQKFWV